MGDRDRLPIRFGGRRPRRTRESMEAQRQKIDNHQFDRGSYFWVWAFYGGKKYVLGPCSSEREAQELAMNKLDCPSEIVELPTRDVGMATRMLKGRELKRTSDLPSSVERVKHKP